ncbi:MAG TPA: hypothetical protein VK694_03235 [Verrucomicrobiae bacterium]|nr:hypothetical protein [Verrucomicrobiae bacterium]
MRFLYKDRRKAWHYMVVAIGYACTFLVPVTGHAQILQMSERYDMISDSTVSSVAIHKFGFTYNDLSNPVGSVVFEFCSNSPLTALPCTVPTGLDVDNAVLFTQAGLTGFNINGAATTPNKLVINRGPVTPTPANAVSEYHFNNITNPDAEGSYYVRLQTFGSSDGTGTALEEGGVVFVMNDMFDVSAEVPPYLRFCASVTVTAFDCSTATSFFIDFGEFSRTQARFASSEMVVATNASFGFSIALAGTTLTSGNNFIPSLAVQAPSSPGNSQFGLNLRANTNPSIGAEPVGPGVSAPTPEYNTPNQYRFTQADNVVTSTTTTDNRKFTVSYVANVSAQQSAGIYATTITFIALANF